MYRKLYEKIFDVLAKYDATTLAEFRQWYDAHRSMCKKCLENENV